MTGKSALLAGASGLVGSELLTILLNSQEYSKITILVRKSIEIKHPKLLEQVINFEELSLYKNIFKVNDVYCCLGTTIKKAKRKEAFKKVDVDYPLEMAKLSKEMECEKFLIISSMGANPDSSIFYSRMKGLVEQKLKETGIKSLHIFRPSLLLGDRKEYRFGESLSAFFLKGLSFLFIGSLKKYKAITAKTVASGMHKAAQSDSTGVHLYLSNEIKKLAD